MDEKENKKETKIAKIVFSKNAHGSLSPRVSLTMEHLKQMGVTLENREVIVSFENDTIMIRKHKKEEKSI